MMRDRS